MQMFLEYQSISGNGLRRMMDAPIIATVQCQTSHGTQQDSEKPGDTQALTREVRLHPIRLNLCTRKKNAHASARRDQQMPQHYDCCSCSLIVGQA